MDLSTWPSMKADLEAKRDAITNLITSIEHAFGIGALGPMLGAPQTISGNGALRKRNGTERNGARRAPGPRASASRSLPDDATSELGDRIVAALKKRNPMRPGDLARVVKLEGYALRALLVKLADAKRIVRKGNGRGAIVMLPGTKLAKEGL